MDPKSDEKNKIETLFDDDHIVDTSISEVISDAFDNIKLSTIGKICLDARVKKSLTQEQASSILKVNVKVIKNFENGDEIELSGLTYKIGFVRSYARILGLDGDFLVKEFKSSLEPSEFKEEYKFPTPQIHNSKAFPMGVILAFLIALTVYSGWYYSERSKIAELIPNGISEDKIPNVTIAEIDNYVIIEEKKTFRKNVNIKLKQDESKKFTELSADINLNKKALQFKENSKNSSLKNVNSLINKEKIKEKESKPSLNLAQINSSKISALANERDRSTEMILKAIGNSWVEIEDIDGNSLMTRLMRSGETYVIPNISGLTFNTGNAGALSLSYGNIIIPSLGEVGEIITARPLKIEAFNDKKNIN